MPATGTRFREPLPALARRRGHPCTAAASRGSPPPRRRAQILLVGLGDALADWFAISGREAGLRNGLS